MGSGRHPPSRVDGIDDAAVDGDLVYSRIVDPADDVHPNARRRGRCHRIGIWRRVHRGRGALWAPRGGEHRLGGGNLGRSGAHELHGDDHQDQNEHHADGRQMGACHPTMRSGVLAVSIDLPGVLLVMSGGKLGQQVVQPVSKCIVHMRIVGASAVDPARHGTSVDDELVPAETVHRHQWVRVHASAHHHG